MATWRGTFAWKLADGTGDEVEAEAEGATLDDALDYLPDDVIPDLDDTDVVAITVHLERVE